VKVDTEKTKVARERHIRGSIALTILFGPTALQFLKNGGGALGGRWLTTLDKKQRSAVRSAKDAANPSRRRARRRRKIAHESRRRNRP
jgi:hypothetical protein